MSNALSARLKQKYRTMNYPDGPAPTLPERFAGKPVVLSDRCPTNCKLCVEPCPTGAISREDQVFMDLGLCLFCRECASCCPKQAIQFTSDYRMAALRREHLFTGSKSMEQAQEMENAARRMFSRSFKLRQVSAGGCNACEADTNVLGTVGWDIGRFGIQFVASPRHADGMLVTGPVSENMRLALLKTYEAIPAPKLVIAAGTCAISGGPYKDHDEVHNGVGNLIPVDLYVPGCPPHPLTILDGLLRLIGRIAD